MPCKVSGLLTKKNAGKVVGTLMKCKGGERKKEGKIDVYGKGKKGNKGEQRNYVFTFELR